VTTTRVLPPSEWPKLAGTLLETVWPSLDPDIDVVLVIERDGTIVGCTSFLPRWHLEGTWIAPTERKKVGVGRLLLSGIYRTASELRVKELLMMSTNKETSVLCRRLGESSTYLDCDHFAVMLRK